MGSGRLSPRGVSGGVAGQPKFGCSLGRRVPDLVARGNAAALEGVVEAEPVADLMGPGLSHAEGSPAGLAVAILGWQAGVEDDDAVHLGTASRSDGNVAQPSSPSPRFAV